MSDIKFEIIQQIGVLSTSSSGWAKELNRMSWNDLIAYERQYLGFSESDARIISALNRQRQDVAHGNNYSDTRDELAGYGAFVRGGVTRGRHLHGTRGSIRW